MLHGWPPLIAALTAFDLVGPIVPPRREGPAASSHLSINCLSIGGKKYLVVFLFQDSKTFKSFVNNGWQATGAASAEAGKKGGGAQTAFVSGMAIYQLDAKGLMASADISGTKYFIDKDLN
jgi:lipid-binding SYLF domain-containing protein